MRCSHTNSGHSRGGIEISYRLIICVSLVVLLAGGPSSCIFFDNFQPTEEQDIDPNNAEALTRKKCTRCHTFERIEKNPRVTWLPTVLRMRYLRLSEMTDDEMTPITAFLDQRYSLPDCPLVDNGDGSELVEYLCRQCHQVDRIFHQVKEEWGSTINRMRDANLCGITDEQVAVIASYLESAKRPAHVTADCGYFANEEGRDQIDDLGQKEVAEAGDILTYVLGVHNRHNLVPMTLTARLPDGLDEIVDVVVEDIGLRDYEDRSGGRDLEIRGLSVPVGGSVYVTLRVRVAGPGSFDLEADLDIDEDGIADVMNRASLLPGAPP